MVELVVHIPRLLCKDCGAIRQPTLNFADPKKHYTHSLERFVIDLCRVMTIADVAELTGLSWDTVKEIDKSYLQRKYHSVSLADVRYIAIDEVYLGRKRKFITIVMDLETGRVIRKRQRCSKWLLGAAKTVQGKHTGGGDRHGKRVYVGSYGTSA